ncbi:MAG: beta-ketoacyl-[acyl-carrier-protein] synthase family protein [Spirochaetales bacterium]|nr:beta-ketoacyl-[acyl-carrier-protein] synthase family protein [Spirochaetales bacterium]
MNLEKRKRIVITGMATINPLGDTLDGYVDNLLAGVSGIKKWKSLDVSGIQCKVGGDLGDYDCNLALGKFENDLGNEQYRKIKKLFRTATFSSKTAVLCALGAYKDAGLFSAQIDPYRVGTIVGGHNFNSKYLYDNGVQFREEPEFIDALSGIEGIDPSIPGLITEALGIYGPSFTVGGACASGNLALRIAFNDILLGECDISLVTGAVFNMCTADIHASEFIGAVSTEKEFMENPQRASRPFDTRRDGFIYSHGAGTLVIEELEAAKARGARIHAEVLGVKANANGNHLPKPDAGKQARLIKDLLASCGVQPGEVDFVSCHATGTPVGDIEEIDAIKEAFGEHAYKLKLNAPKSMLGHTCWAAPIVETIGGIMQMHRGELHPTINVDEVDPAVDLDICLGGRVSHKINIMLKNSFGFGGLNSCSLIKKYEE